MSRYEDRLLRLQIMAESCESQEDRAMILGELAALREAYSFRERIRPHQTLSSEG